MEVVPSHNGHTPGFGHVLHPREFTYAALRGAALRVLR